MASSRTTISTLMTIVAAVAFILYLSINRYGLLLVVVSSLPMAILSPYLLWPRRLHRTNWIGLDPIVEPLDPRGPEAPPEVIDATTKAVENLATIGFTIKYAYRLVGLGPALTGYAALFEHPEGDVAKLILAQVGSRPISATSLAYLAEFEDGTEVITGWTKTPMLYPPPQPPTWSAVIPGVPGPAALHSIHVALVARHAAGKVRSDHLRGGLLASHRRMSEQFHDRLVAVGYYLRDEPAGRLRPTWKGATLMAWKLLWPVKPIRTALRRRQANRLVRGLGLGSPKRSPVIR